MTIPGAAPDEASSRRRPHALRVLERLGASRDPARTCSAEVLTTLFHERGLPAFGPVLEFEQRFGGVTWGKDVFGACCALRSGVDLRTLAGLVGSDLEDYLGEVFLPISFRSHYPRANYWMNAAGTIYMVHEADSFPVADSAACFWEREALRAGEPGALTLHLKWCAMPTFTEADFARFENRGMETEEENEEAPPAPYDEDPQAVFDASLAAAIDLPLFGPATDRWRRVWFDGKRLLYPHYPWQPADRLVRTLGMDELVPIARAVRAVRSSAVAAFDGPLGDAPGADEPIAAQLLACDEREDLVGELLFIGQPGSYRAHLRRYDQPQSLHRLWQEREEAWQARHGLSTDGHRHEQ